MMGAAWEYNSLARISGTRGRFGGVPYSEGTEALFLGGLFPSSLVITAFPFEKALFPGDLS